MRVRITTPARNDIRALYDYLERVAGRRKAREIAAELRERCHGLSRMPERYQHLAGFEAADLRRRVYRDYLIVYTITKQDVNIIRVLHGASDVESILHDMAST